MRQCIYIDGNSLIFKFLIGTKIFVEFVWAKGFYFSISVLLFRLHSLLENLFAWG